MEKKAQEKSMDTTITLEFFSETKERLKTLEQQLKHEHYGDVDLLEPKDATAPVLVAIGIKKHGERAEKAGDYSRTGGGARLRPNLFFQLLLSFVIHMSIEPPFWNGLLHIKTRSPFA